MKQLTPLILLSFVVTFRALAADLSLEDTKHLLERALKIKAAFDKGDADTIIEMTHPSIYALTNGKEGFEKLTRGAMELVKSMGITIIESSLGTPTRTYVSGTVTVCFIPRISVMSVQGKKVKSIGFLIAARNRDNEKWLFLDGSGLRKNPTLLKSLFPGLPDDVKLPENRLEKIE